MQKSTKGRGPVIVAALGTVVVALLFFGSLLWVMLEEEPIPAVIGIMVVYGLLAVAIVVGVLYAMVQRLREIQGGEEDEARPSGPAQAGRGAGDLVFCHAADHYLGSLRLSVLYSRYAPVGHYIVSGPGYPVSGPDYPRPVCVKKQIQRNRRRRIRCCW